MLPNSLQARPVENGSSTRPLGQLSLGRATRGVVLRSANDGPSASARPNRDALTVTFSVRWTPRRARHAAADHQRGEALTLAPVLAADEHPWSACFPAAAEALARLPSGLKATQDAFGRVGGPYGR